MKQKKIKAPESLMNYVNKDKKEYSFSSRQLLKAIELGAKKIAIKKGLSIDLFCRQELNEHSYITQLGDYFTLENGYITVVN